MINEPPKWICKKGHSDYRITTGIRHDRGDKIYTRYVCRICHREWSKKNVKKYGYKHQISNTAHLGRRYAKLHIWLNKSFPKTNCVNCGATGIERKLEFANISGTYKWDGSDFKVLCKPCHWKFDHA